MDVFDRLPPFIYNIFVPCFFTGSVETVSLIETLPDVLILQSVIEQFRKYSCELTCNHCLALIAQMYIVAQLVVFQIVAYP